MKSYGRFMGFIMPQITIFSIAVICMILSSLFGASPLGMIIPVVDIIITGKKIVLPDNVYVPQIIAHLVDHVNTMSKLQLLNVLTMLMVVFFLLKEIFLFLQTYLMSVVSERVIRDIKNSIYSKLLDLSMSFYSSQPTGLLMARITHDSAVVRDAIGTGVADMFYQPIQLVVYTAMLIGVKIYFNIPWDMIVVAVIIFPLILVPVVKIGKKLKKISKQTQEKIADINNMLLETITGMKLVKSFNMEEYEKKRFEDQNQTFYKLTLKSVKRVKIISPMTEAMGILCVTIILWVAGKSIISGDLSAGAFAAFLAATLSMMKPIKRLSSIYGINQQALAAVERIFQIIDTPISVKESDHPAVLKDFTNEIRFENVSFRYDNKKDTVLKNIDLAIKKGEIIALVGPSGGGKTTMVNLIPRFYDASAGRISIDGLDIRDISMSSLRGKIGLVTQETLLFNDTIKMNLCYGHEVDEGRMIEAAKAANAHDFIKEFPKGYDTVVGERGVMISGGQRQRLALARAVYKNPPILILDEATSQLDSESEKLVQEAINNLMKGRTTIAIAHRLSTITHSDRIIVMEKGSIVDIGTHKELIDRSPLYKRLYEIQFSERVEE